MAPRGRTPLKGDQMVHAHEYDSSPDPLALSFNEHTSHAKRTTTRKDALFQSSPGKTNRRTNNALGRFSSPAKSMFIDTPAVGGASPWRIKVTVQAEPDEEDAQSPTVQRQTTTRTTTIPLKDADASSPVKRARGRPRKSDAGATPKPKAKRKGTPVRRTSRSKSRDLGSDIIESSAGDVDTDAPTKRRRGRPKKSLSVPVDTQDIRTPEPESEAPSEADSTQFPTSRPSKTASRKNTRFATPVAEAANTSPIPPSGLSQNGNRDGSPRIPPGDRRQYQPYIEYEMPVMDTPRQTELAKRLRARKSTPHANKLLATAFSDNESEEGSDVLTPTSDTEDDEPMITAPDAESEADVDVGAAGFGETTKFAFEEGMTRMPDDPTIMDSEHFTMISIDSLPSRLQRSSPPKPTAADKATTNREDSISRHEYLNPAMLDHTTIKAQGSSMGPPKTIPTRHATGPPLPDPSAAPPRYQTPVLDPVMPPAPPAMQPVQSPAAKPDTPDRVRAVTAGVALQGVVDPTRLTPVLSQQADKEQLNDLFRGFSEGTRRELQAGLRLGEQLASEVQPPSPSGGSSRTEISSRPERRTGPLKTQRKHREPRLLTPDESDHQAKSSQSLTAENDVRYPEMIVDQVENQLLSPARSEREVSLRSSVPLEIVTTASQKDVVMQDHSEVLQQDQGGITTTAEAPGTEPDDEYSDIWQEEASRSSNNADPKEPPAESLSLSDLLGSEDVMRPARAKLPRTWRRTSGNPFQYSDEAESPPQKSALKPSIHAPIASQVEHHQSDNADTMNESMGDAGIFFRPTQPRVPRQNMTKRPDLATIINEGESLQPESSPQVMHKKTASALTKVNPFLDTPPRFAAIHSSPQKRSPLRQQNQISELAPSSPRHIEDESTLPIAQSSPFHTFVEGQSRISAASDQRQFRIEMEGLIDTSLHRLRNEADGYLDAYEAQERSLDEIEEVTEPSMTWRKERSILPSSPPRLRRSYLASGQHTSPLLDTSQPPQSLVDGADDEDADESDTPTTEPQPADSVNLPTTAAPHSTDLLTRLTTTFFRSAPTISATPPSTPAPTQHPLLNKLQHLPAIHPWTRTHYKALDKLYAMHLRHPSLFSPTASPATPLSITNAHLLSSFLASTGNPYIGARYTAWSYHTTLTQELVVLCAVYMELLSLPDIEAYEADAGRKIEVGECAPGVAGETIQADEVVRRLATVVLGEMCRRDEKNGMMVRRRGALKVEWPEE